MRVRLNHGTAGWHSFTGFLAYGRRLAALAGLDLDAMEGVGGTRPWSSVGDDVAPLRAMTDGVGFVRATECGRVGRRLRALVERIPIDDPEHTLTLLVRGWLPPWPEAKGASAFTLWSRPAISKAIRTSPTRSSPEIPPARIAANRL